jgi:hypothetical protein
MEEVWKAGRAEVSLENRWCAKLEAGAGRLADLSQCVGEGGRAPA